MNLRRITVCTGLVAGLLALAAPASACTPHVNATGPSIIIQPFPPGDPISNFIVDTEGMYVEVVTCLE